MGNLDWNSCPSTVAVILQYLCMMYMKHERYILWDMVLITWAETLSSIVAILLCDSYQTMKDAVCQIWHMSLRLKHCPSTVAVILHWYLHVCMYDFYETIEDMVCHCQIWHVSFRLKHCPSTVTVILYDLCMIYMKQLKMQSPRHGMDRLD